MVRTTEWMKGAELTPKLEIGDMVVFRRGFLARFFNHWGVYVGTIDGVQSIAHMSADGGSDATIEMEETLPNSSKKCTAKTVNVRKVRIDPFLTVAKTEDCLISNHLDEKYTPYPPVKIKERAFMILELGTAGNRTIEKDFAKWCRYGSTALNKEWVANRNDFIKAAVATTAAVGVGFVTANPALPVNVFQGTLTAIESVSLARQIIRDPAWFYGVCNTMKHNFKEQFNLNDKFY